MDSIIQLIDQLIIDNNLGLITPRDLRFILHELGYRVSAPEWEPGASYRHGQFLRVGPQKTQLVYVLKDHTSATSPPGDDPVTDLPNAFLGDVGLQNVLPIAGSGGTPGTGVTPPTDQTILQHYDWVPGVSNIITGGNWRDARLDFAVVEDLADLSDRQQLPLNHMQNGKIVYVRTAQSFYEFLADATTITDTIADWRAMATGVTYVGRMGNLPDPNQEVLTNGQQFVVRLDVSGFGLYRMVTWDENNQVWQFINRKVWDKARRSDQDQATDQQPGDLQITHEPNHEEIKAWNHPAGQWDTIYSRDAIDNAIAAMSLFEGTVTPVGQTVAGAVEFDQLPDLQAMTAQTDLSKTSHYWTYVGPSNYNVVGPPNAQPTPVIGEDLDGAILNPGDWVMVSNRGGDGSGVGAGGGPPDLRWVTVGGDLLAKARADRLFGLQPWAAAGWEQGSLCLYQGDIYRADQPVTASDPVPDDAASIAAGTNPWSKVNISGGLKVAGDDSALPATAPPGQVWIVLSSAMAGGEQALFAYDTAAAQWQRLGGGGTPMDLSGGDSLINIGMPVGSVVAYAGAAAPRGWLVCDGSPFDPMVYPELQAVLGQAVTPDLIDQFIRGGPAADPFVLKDDTTRMPRNAFTTDQQGSHTHSTRSKTGWPAKDGSDVEWNKVTAGGTGSYNGTGHPTNASGAHTHTINGGDAETAPKHVILMYIIKAADTGVETR